MSSERLLGSSDAVIKLRSMARRNKVNNNRLNTQLNLLTTDY